MRCNPRNAARVACAESVPKAQNQSQAGSLSNVMCVFSPAISYTQRSDLFSQTEAPLSASARDKHKVKRSTFSVNVSSQTHREFEVP